MKRLIMLFLVALLLAGCEMKSSPKNLLSSLAESLEKNDASAFLERLDLRMCARAENANMTEESEALSTLDRLGRNLGLGSMKELLDNVLDTEERLAQNFTRKISRGDLVGECMGSREPFCPWIPSSLRSAEVHEFGGDIAVAKVRTPKNVTTWLSMAKKEGKWKIVGWAYVEKMAQRHAQMAMQKEEAVPHKPEKTTPKKGDDSFTL